MQSFRKGLLAVGKISAAIFIFFFIAPKFGQFAWIALEEAGKLRGVEYWMFLAVVSICAGIAVFLAVWAARLFLRTIRNKPPAPPEEGEEERPAASSIFLRATAAAVVLLAELLAVVFGWGFLREGWNALAKMPHSGKYWLLLAALVFLAWYLFSLSWKSIKFLAFSILAAIALARERREETR